MSEPVEIEPQDEYANFDFAIMAIFATYVFEVSTEFGNQRSRLYSSKFWHSSDKRLDKAVKAMRISTFQAISLSLATIIASAIGISLPTRNLDERMVWILEGLSLLFASVVIGRLSFGVARWAGVYYKIWEEPSEEDSHTIKELQFRSRWGYYRLFGRFFFFLLPFFQGVNALTIPLSMVAGIGAGFFADGFVFLARRKEKYKRPIVVCFIVIGVFGSSWLLASGIYFIAKVWGHYDDPKREVWLLSSFLACIFVESMLHVYQWYRSRKKLKDAGTSQVSEAYTQHRPRMATSLIIEARKRKRNNITTSGSMSQGINDQTEHETEESGDIPSDNDVTETDGLQEQKVVSNSKELNGDTSPDVDNGGGDDVASEKASKSDPELATGLPDDDSVGKVEHDDDADEDNYPVPSYCQLFRRYWTCCGCVRGNDRTCSEKAWSCFYWIAWYALVVFSLYLVAVNIGATVQQEAAREKLPYVQRTVYDFMDEGPVCAFDNKGADSNITTFPDKEAAHAEGFLVLHCGECAACSDWHNLQREYATRHFLAEESARCAKKSLAGGRQAVLDCLKLAPIDFQGKCAECWTDDILCTKGFCAMIFLQSTIINTAGNFQVGEDAITSATCEEAHCEAGNPGDFVYCSGATRRRMNITSTIQRPGAQRCAIVDVDWAEVFPDAA